MAHYRVLKTFVWDLNNCFIVQMFDWDPRWTPRSSKYITVCLDLWGEMMSPLLSLLLGIFLSTSFSSANGELANQCNATTSFFTFCISRLLRSSYCFQHGGPGRCLPIEGFYKFWLNFVQWKFIKGRLGGSKTWGNLLWWLHLYQVRF